MTPKTRVLVFGSTGMLGHVVLRMFAADAAMEVTGTARNAGSVRLLPEALRSRVVVGIDVENPDHLVAVFDAVRPTVVVNCVGLVKQLSSAEDPLAALPINSLFPHRLSRLCGLAGARLIHISTDCVFAGSKGNYTEQDVSDAKDLYGRSKYIGEVDAPHAITLRTSIIGHELGSTHGLLEWFLAQTGPVKGYRRAIFSGVPTMELARVARDFVLPRPQLRGVYHVAATPISKLDLITLFAQEYGKSITIIPDDQVVIDRSLDARRFRDATGYEAPGWPELVRRMRDFR